MLHTAEEAGRGDPSLVWVSRSSSVQNHQRLASTETHERTEVLERLDVVWSAVSDRRMGTKGQMWH